jgi:hydroxypyruvate isomerase
MSGLRFEANLSILFKELPLLERPEAARRAGFDAVEFWWPWPVAVPSDAEIGKFVAAITDAGVQLVGLNFFAGDMPGGDRGLVSWRERSTEFRDNIDVTIGVGEQVGCRAFNALYGNRQDDADFEDSDRLGVDNLVLAAKAAQRIGGTVLVEPVSGAPRYPLRTAADALGVIDRACAQGEVDNVKLLFDIYHLAVNGDDIEAAIDRAAGRIGHVQIADAPGRHEPGTGELAITDYLDRIAATGYDGWVGLEYSPSGASQDAFDWLPIDRRSSAR